MMASELIKQLQACVDEYGDAAVFVLDDDTCDCYNGDFKVTTMLDNNIHVIDINVTGWVI